MSDDVFNPSIRLSAVDEISPVVAVVDAGLQKLQASVDAVSSKLGLLGEAKKKAAADGITLEAVAGKLAGTFIRMAEAAVAVGVGIAAWQFQKAIKEGLEFSSMLEKNNLSLAALQLSFSQYVDATGKPVSATRQWADASRDATTSQDLLLKQSLQSAASFTDLAGIYQKVYGAAISGGAKSLQQVVTFTGTIADMAAVTGQSYTAAANQMSLALLGVTRTAGKLGALLRAMGVDNATLKSWREQGIVVEELQKKLHAFQEMQPALQQTWVGITTNMKTAWQLFAGAISADVFVQLKQDMNDALHGVLDFDTGKLQSDVLKAAREIGAGVKGALDIAVSTVKSWLDIVTGTLTDHGATWKDVFEAVGTSIVFLSQAVGDAILNMTNFLRSPIDSMLGSITKAIAGTIEFLLRALANFADQVAKVAAMAAGATGGAVGASIADQAARDSIALRAQADAWKSVRDVGGATTTELTKGLDANAAAALKAYTAIQNIGKSAAELSTDPNGLMFKLLYGDGAAPLTYGGTGDRARANPTTPDTSNTSKAADYAAKTAAIWDRANAYTQVGLSKELSMIEATLAKEIDAATQKGISEAEITVRIAALKAEANNKMLGVFRERLQKEDDAEEKSAQKKAGRLAWVLAEERKIKDAIAGISDDYYVRQQASLDKQDDALRTVHAKRLADNEITKKQYDELIALVDKLAAAQTARLKREEESIIGLRRHAEDAAAVILKTTDSLADGMRFGMLRVLATMKSFTEISGAFVIKVWQDMGTAFSTGFYDVLTGKLGDLEKTFKKFGESILQGLSNVFAGIAEKWLLTEVGITKDPKTGKITFGGQGKGSLDDLNAGGALAGGVIGYGVGSAASASSGAPGWSSGSSIGGVAGGVLAGAFLGTELGASAGIYGAIIGAVVGGIIGIFAAANTEMHQFISNFGPNGAVIDKQMQPLNDSMGAAALGIYGSSGLKDRKGFGTSVNDALQNLLQYRSFEIHAGSDEDMAKNYKRLMETIIPQEQLKMLFGQKAIGGQDYAGISGGLKYDGKIGADGPFTKMLTDLGFTAAKIQSISDQIDLRAPAAFLKYLDSLVGVVKSFNALSADLKKSPSEWFNNFAAADSRGPGDIFGAGIQNMVDLAGELALYTGDAQIAKAQELVKLAEQYGATQVAYLRQLYTLQQALTRGIADQIQGMRLDLMSKPDQQAFHTKDAQDALNMLGGATTAQQVNDLVTRIQKDISSAWNLSGKTDSNLASMLEGILRAAGELANSKIASFAADATARNTELAAAMAQATSLFTALGTSVLPVHSSTVVSDTGATAAHEAATKSSTSALYGMRDAVDDVAASMRGLAGWIADGGLAGYVAAAFRNDPTLLQRGTGQ